MSSTSRFETHVDPLVSVIIPAYNCRRHIRQAVDSVLEQTYADVELIVVDDGSTDDTLAVLETYGSRIKVLRQKNAGAAAARNTGMLAAKGALLAFLDADDYWVKEKTEVQVEYMRRNPHVGLVYNAWRLVGATDSGDHSEPTLENRFALVGEESGWIYHILLNDCIVHTSSVMIRRAIVEKIGLFDVSLRRGQDYDYWLRVSRIAEIHKLQAVLSVYRLHESSITKKALPTNFEYQVLSRALKRWGRTGPDGRRASWAGTQKVLARTWLNFAYRQSKAGNFVLALRAYTSSLMLWPVQVDSWRGIASALVRAFCRAIGLPSHRST